MPTSTLRSGKPGYRPEGNHAGIAYAEMRPLQPLWYLLEWRFDIDAYCYQVTLTDMRPRPPQEACLKVFATRLGVGSHPSPKSGKPALIPLSASEKVEGPQRVVHAHPKRDAGRRLYGLELTFTPGWPQYALDLPLGRIASMPAPAKTGLSDSCSTADTHTSGRATTCRKGRWWTGHPRS